jgi:hypothetical protein
MEVSLPCFLPLWMLWYMYKFQKHHISIFFSYFVIKIHRETHSQSSNAPIRIFFFLNQWFVQLFFLYGSIQCALKGLPTIMTPRRILLNKAMLYTSQLFHKKTCCWVWFIVIYLSLFYTTWTSWQVQAKSLSTFANYYPSGTSKTTVMSLYNSSSAKRYWIHANHSFDEPILTNILYESFSGPVLDLTVFFFFFEFNRMTRRVFCRHVFRRIVEIQGWDEAMPSTVSPALKMILHNNPDTFSYMSIFQFLYTIQQWRIEKLVKITHVSYYEIIFSVPRYMFK